MGWGERYEGERRQERRICGERRRIGENIWGRGGSLENL
jgi:hypothetical protein